MADEIENLVLNANASGLITGALAGADALSKLAVNVGLTDDELDKAQIIIDKTSYQLRSLVAAYTASAEATKTASLGLRDYTASAAGASAALERLEEQQLRVNSKALAGLSPTLTATSLSGNRNPNGTFAAAGVNGLTEEQLAAVVTAEKLKTTTVAQEAAKRLAYLTAEGQAELTELRAVAAQEEALYAEQAAALSAARYVPGVTARGPVATAGSDLSASELAAMSAAYGRTTTAVAQNTEKIAENAVAQKAVGQNLITSRYALYSVAQTYGIATGAIAAFDVLSIKAAADFGAAFVNIARSTTDTKKQLADLYKGLVDLSTQIPVSFVELAKIGTLGAQLNITGSGLLTFTKNIAEFSQVTGITVEAAATGIGRIGQLLKVPESEYANLASAILYVGNKSVATEAQVLTMSQGIAAAGRSAGLTAPQVVALAGTLASIGVQTYAARGATQTLFGDLNRAVGEGGSTLEAFANIAGESASKFATEYGSNAQGALSKFLGGLHSLTESGANITEVLDSVGIRNVNIVRTITSLSQNTGLYNKLLQESGDQYTKGTYLSDSYAKVNATLASSFKKLGDTVEDIFAAIGGGPNGQLLAKLVSGLEGAAKAGLDFVNTPVGSELTSIGALLLTIVGLYTGYRTVVALSTAATYALITAQRAQATNGFAGGIKGTIQALTELRTGTVAVTAVTETSATAMGIQSVAATEDAAVLGALGVATDAAAISQDGLVAKIGTATGKIAVGIGTVAKYALGIGAIVFAADAAAGALDSVGDKTLTSQIKFKSASDAAAAYNRELQTANGFNLAGSFVGLSNPFAARPTDSKSLTLQTLGNSTAGPSGGFNSFLSGIGVPVPQLKDANTAISKIDASMSKLVAGGNAKEATAQFKNWTDAAKILGIPLSSLDKLFPDYTAAIKKYGDTAGSAGTRTDVLSGQFGKAAFNAAVLKTNTLALETTLSSYGSSAQTAESATEAYYNALDTANSAIKTNRKATDDSTAAGRANNQALYGLASAANAVAEANLKNKVPLAQVQAGLVTARAQFIQTAEQMGYTADQATNLANKLVTLGTFKYNYDANGIHIATNDINTYLTALGKIPGSVSLPGFSTPGAGNLLKPRAGGGTVASGETTLVGENGPEIAQFPAGTRIYPNGVTPHYAQTASAAAASGSSKNAGVLELGPRTIRALSQATTPVYLDGKVLTDSVNGHNQKRNRRGR